MKIIKLIYLQQYLIFGNIKKNFFHFQVVELLSKNGESVQVSLWIRQLDNDGPCLVVAEPVTCKNVVVS